MKSKDYYTLLGIQENASENEIKEAFRTRAKKYHPDINDHPDAADMFIKLTEAYQYAIEKYEFIQKFRDYLKEKEAFENRWREQRQRKAREYAKRHARMKYEKFEKSYIYKSANIFFTLYDYIIFFLGIFIIISSILGVYLTIQAQKFTAETVIMFIFAVLLGSLFVAFTYKRFKRKR